MSSDIPGEAVTASRRLAKGIGTTILARMGAVIEVVAQPLYVLMFGLAGYGFYAVLWAAITLVSRFCELGMTSGLQRTVPQCRDPQAERQALVAAMVFGIAPAILVAALASLFAEELAGLVNVAESDAAMVAPAIRLFAWALPLWVFIEVATAALRAKQLFGPEIRLRIVWEQLLRLLLAALFFFSGMDLLGMFLAHILSLTITATLSGRLLARHFQMRPGQGDTHFATMAKDSLLAGLASMPQNITVRLFSDAPPLVLNAILPGTAGAASAGLFVIIRKIASLVHLVRIAFAYVLAPVASMAQRDERAQVAEIYGFAVRLATVVALPLALAMSGGAPALLSMFGREAQIAALPLAILLLARALEAAFGPAQPILQVTGRYRSQAHGSLIGLAAAGIVGAIWIWDSPLVGMAAAVATGVLMAAIVPVIQLWRHQALVPALHDSGRMLVAALGSGAVAALALWSAAAWLSWPWILALMTPVTLAAVWCAARWGLTVADRRALGKVGRQLSLI